ncbi:hypothetical protein [Mycobacteroides chelonae]|uniref:hypothetical protein n=1 Tax=Mycobacteroides chelonae TaxID=1774 RepID=UPI0008A9C278|nr:hypothetical protein [Mycobacteroides chelonae]OHU29058.1 hypothetical protein BKG78_23605 [Mycobacteroides chelonae]
MTQLGDTLNAIDRGAVLGILGAADEVLATKQLAERQTHALNAVREIHRPLENSISALYPQPQCDGCGEDSPCATIRALDEAGV